MATVFLSSLSPMLMMFACMVIGFILNKKKICPDNTASVLSKLEANVLAPALTIGTFSKYCTVESLSEQYSLILFCALILAIAIGIAFALAPLFTGKGYNRNVYRYALTFGNFGFMGNAIVPAIFGEAALYEYMLFALPLNIAVYTWGIASLIPRGEGKQSLLKNLLNPSVFALAIGATLGLTGVSKYLPAFVNSTLSGLGGCMGPIAMVLTGFLIGQYPIKKLLSDKKVYIASVLRLFILPALFVVILKLLGANNTALTMCFFAFGTPLGLNTVVFPAAYGGDPSTGVSMATISHTVCVITIPIMYALLTAFIL
ncbi:MAG: AEC family transporter [Oscillospiraceae bacterium]|nr:AEC family transporter [Oscillospiraceae bacterium]